MRRLPGWSWSAAALLAAVLSCAALPCAAAQAQNSAAATGEKIYRHGLLPSGQLLTARRDADLQIVGDDAACSNCHRRSGFGEVEGRITIPPISGPYLFHPRAKDRDDLDLPFVEGMHADRDPYDDASLARAIRDGIDLQGRPLNYLMPHFALDDASMAVLIEYLKHMLPSRVPGVTKSVLHFATIITPDADAVKRKGMLDVLNQYFTDKNAFARAESPRLQSSHRMMFKANRRWALHVWELTGAPATWEAQLKQHLIKEPVFAVISGLGGKTWAPVHHFCEQAALPCLFPNVELPVVAEHDFYSLYFSRGVLLEADLMASRVAAGDALGAPRIVQIFRSTDVGAAAAKELNRAAAQAGLRVIDRPISGGASSGQLAAALGGVNRGDTLVLWLRPGDVADLARTPPPAHAVMMSGLMGGLGNAPLPESWRAATELAYPFDLPEKRRIRMDYPLGWFHIRHIPLVAEQVQTDTYLACGLVSETLSHMSDSFYRDYLIERMEGMLEHRIITGYYPRLALAPNQRFASKGGYLVRFAEPSGTRLLPDGDWLVP